MKYEIVKAGIHYALKRTRITIFSEQVTYFDMQEGKNYWHEKGSQYFPMDCWTEDLDKALRLKEKFES